MTDSQINFLICEITGDDPHWKGAKDYCNDLNAMHEAEAVLTERQFLSYAFALNDIDGSLWGIRATARQRAEAFLRTMGKWEEAK